MEITGRTASAQLYAKDNGTFSPEAVVCRDARGTVTRWARAGPRGRPNGGLSLHVLISGKAAPGTVFDTPAGSARLTRVTTETRFRAYDPPSRVRDCGVPSESELLGRDPAFFLSSVDNS